MRIEVSVNVTAVTSQHLYYYSHTIRTRIELKGSLAAAGFHGFSLTNLTPENRLAIRNQPTIGQVDFHLSRCFL